MESTAAPVPIDQLLAHRAWLRRIARALVGDPQTADDLMQEVWLAAMERPPRNRRSLRGWLATVLRRKAIDCSRAADRRAHHESGQLPPPRGASADELIAETETHQRVTDAVLALDEPYRSTLVLRYVGGHPIAEVARLQDVPVETVRTRLKRGLARLRERLDGEHGGDRGAWMALLVPLAWPHKALGISAGTAATLTGGVIVSSKLMAVASAVVVVALATWASFGLIGSDVDSNGAIDDTALVDVEGSLAVDGSAPLLEGRFDEAGDPPAPAADAEPAVELSSLAVRGAAMPGPEAAPGRIGGRVTTTDGEVLTGITIIVERLDENGETVRDDRFPIHWGADPYGWFRVDDLPEGLFHLRVSAPGYIERMLDARSGAEQVEIALEQGAPLSGRVVSEDPQVPLAGVPLIARPEESPVVGRAAHAVTDPEGRFVFEGLARGAYLITLGQRGMAAADPIAALVPVRAGPFHAGRNDVEVPLGLGETISGTVVDEAGNPITMPVRVEALGLTAEDQKDYDRRYFSGATNGAFELVGLVHGRYSLSFDPITQPALRVLRGPRTTCVDNVVSGTTELEVTLFDGLAVHGRLVDGEGKAVSGKGFVQVRPAGSVSGSQDAVILTVDSEGRFHTPPLDPTSVYVVSVGSFEGRMAKTVQGVVPSEAPLVIELASGGRITGRVVDENGAPATGTSVVAYAKTQPLGTKGRNGFTYVDPNGHFALEGLGEFEFTVFAGGAASGFVAAGEPTVVKAGQTDVLLHVKRGVPFSGRLVDEHGRPIKSPYVAATDGRTAWFTLVSDDEGHFRLPGVPAGKISIGARIDGEYVSLGEFEAPAEDVTITVPAR